MSKIKLKNVDQISRKTVSDAFANFMRHCQLKNLAPHTYTYYKENLQFFFDSAPQVQYVFKGWTKMNLSDCYLEEDLFPKIFTDYEERNYGILFYNEDNKDSFDSNHAVIYKDKIKDLPDVLSDIVYFYSSKGICPIIYQSMLDDNWFGEIKEDLAAAGFRSWVEDQEYMLPAAENLITPNPEVEVRKVTEWKDELEQVFLAAEEPWEIKVARKTLEYPKAWMFAAYLEDKPAGLLYGHISERACRVDYLLVAKKYRKTGVGRTLFYQYMEWCKENGIHNIYIWPDGDTPKRIYEEGGFRITEIRKAGRAVFEAD